MKNNKLEETNNNLDQIEELAKSICRLDDEEVKEIQLETIQFRIKMIRNILKN